MRRKRHHLLSRQSKGFWKKLAFELKKPVWRQEFPATEMLINFVTEVESGRTPDQATLQYFSESFARILDSFYEHAQAHPPGSKGPHEAAKIDKIVATNLGLKRTRGQSVAPKTARYKNAKQRYLAAVDAGKEIRSTPSRDPDVIFRDVAKRWVVDKRRLITTYELYREEIHENLEKLERAETLNNTLASIKEKNVESLQQVLSRLQDRFSETGNHHDDILLDLDRNEIRQFYNVRYPREITDSGLSTRATRLGFDVDRLVIRSPSPDLVSKTLERLDSASLDVDECLYDFLQPCVANESGQHFEANPQWKVPLGEEFLLWLMLRSLCS